MAEVWFYVSWVYTGAFDTALHASPTYFVDDAVTVRRPPENDGRGYLLADLCDATRTIREEWCGTTTPPGHPVSDLDFDEIVDSDGNTGLDPEIGIRLTMRMSYREIMAVFAREYGYEYGSSPPTWSTGTWLWQVFNPGGWESTVGSRITSPSIQGGSSDTRRSVRKYLARYTDVMIEGLGRITGRDRDAT